MREQELPFHWEMFFNPFFNRVNNLGPEAKEVPRLNDKPSNFQVQYEESDSKDHCFQQAVRLRVRNQ